MIEIEVPEVAPSLNRLMRMHWATRRALRKKWEWVVWYEAYRVQGAAAIRYDGRVSVRIVRRSHHVLDEDNLHGAAKLILDALKSAKVIQDDSPAHITLTCEQEKGPARTVIQVTPINALPAPPGSPGEPC